VTVATLLTGVALLGSCTGGDEDRDPADRSGRTTLPEAEDQLDEGLMLALGQAKNFHRKAKVYMTDGNLAEAIAAVRQILSIEFPPGSPEGEDVRLDAHALLAKLLVASGDVEGAMKAVDQGIAASTRDSFFLANLHTVKGEVHEAIAAGFADPQAPEAIAARRAAISEYDLSIQINERLQKALAERLKAAP